MSAEPKKIAIIDYGLGNLFSVKQALLKVGAAAEITDNFSEILKADAVVLPGVGAFSQAMQNLKEKNLDAAIFETLAAGKKLMGVCLGLQLLFESSDEFGATEGLGILKGQVRKIPENFQDKVLRIPQIAWNKVQSSDGSLWKKSPLQHVRSGAYMYFVHSYYVEPGDQTVSLSHTSYEGFDYCSSVFKEQVFATQFHPEKSAEAGVGIYREWLRSV